MNGTIGFAKTIEDFRGGRHSCENSGRHSMGFF
jgi:hypothetical protein